jgi:hypothetical protein
MGLLDKVLGNAQQQQELQNYVQRYEQGAPHEGYSDQEVLQRYQQVAPQLGQQDYLNAAEQAFNRMSPQDRAQFGQFVQQQAQSHGVSVPGFGQGASPEAYQDPHYLAQQAAQLHEQQPGLLSQLLGAAAGAAGGNNQANSQGSGLIGSPVAKAALAGIAAMAVSNALGNKSGSGNPLGSLLGNRS